MWRVSVFSSLILVFACGDEGRGGGMMPDGSGSTMCLDQLYTEELPNQSADISDIQFTDVQSYVDEVLQRRYPLGAVLVAQGRMSTGVIPQDCDVYFSNGASVASEVHRSLDTIVHECGHLADLEAGGFADDVFIIRQDLILTCQGGDTTSRGGNTIARSRINEDSFSALRPPCTGGGTACDSYAEVYLDGNPDDSIFDSGDQGFNSVIEEAVQYINSLAVNYAFLDQLPSGLRTSARDGLLTFLWYIQRYLRTMRLDYPAAYDSIVGSSCWREVILNVWGRAQLFLDVTEGITQLSLDDSLMELVENPEMLMEIQLVREAHGC